ncbi:MAG: ABC transporter permease [Planctomycetes bacterium]|nr:ABC transporter permease [Planctomycetota bacterium]
MRAGGRTLLENAAARFRPGEVALILGPSGAGKSLLLRVIAGLLDRSHASVDVAGSVRVGGEEVLGRRARARVGVVFQQFALFDELSPARNVRFAYSHRRRNHDDESVVDPAALLDELQVPRHARVSRLSGGQQQRLAIARTLASDPDIVLYDEPTSGLDAATADQVAALIRRTHRAHPKTAIVVTHDYESLVGIADRVHVLDAEAHALREVPRADWPSLREQLTATPRTAAPPPRSRPLGAAQAASRRLGAFLAGTSRVAEAAAGVPAALLPLWRSFGWGGRYLAHYLRLVAGPSAWLYLAVTGAILGYVATHFTFEYMPYSAYTEPLITEEVLGAIGYALYRILVPLIGTILIAARCGAAVASDIGNKTYGRQTDAMRSLGADPRRYLLTSVLWAFLIGTPVLVGVAFVTSRWASLIAFSILHPELGRQFWEQHLHTQLMLPGEPVFEGTWWLLAKVLSCALGIAAITYHQGARPKPAATSVSVGITAAILWSTLWALIVHFAFAFFEFRPPT